MLLSHRSAPTSPATSIVSFESSHLLGPTLVPFDERALRAAPHCLLTALAQCGLAGDRGSDGRVLTSLQPRHLAEISRYLHTGRCSLTRGNARSGEADHDAWEAFEYCGLLTRGQLYDAGVCVGSLVLVGGDSLLAPEHLRSVFHGSEVSPLLPFNTWGIAPSAGSVFQAEVPECYAPLPHRRKPSPAWLHSVRWDASVRRYEAFLRVSPASSSPAASPPSRPQGVSLGHFDSVDAALASVSAARARFSADPDPDAAVMCTCRARAGEAGVTPANTPTSTRAEQQQLSIPRTTVVQLIAAVHRPVECPALVVLTRFMVREWCGVDEALGADEGISTSTSMPSSSHSGGILCVDAAAAGGAVVRGTASCRDSGPPPPLWFINSQRELPPSIDQNSPITEGSSIVNGSALLLPISLDAQLHTPSVDSQHHTPSVDSQHVPGSSVLLLPSTGLISGPGRPDPLLPQPPFRLNSGPGRPAHHPSPIQFTPTMRDPEVAQQSRRVHGAERHPLDPEAIRGINVKSMVQYRLSRSCISYRSSSNATASSENSGSATVNSSISGSSSLRSGYAVSSVHCSGSRLEVWRCMTEPALGLLVPLTETHDADDDGYRGPVCDNARRPDAHIPIAVQSSAAAAATARGSVALVTRSVCSYHDCDGSDYASSVPHNNNCSSRIQSSRGSSSLSISGLTVPHLPEFTLPTPKAITVWLRLCSSELPHRPSPHESGERIRAAAAIALWVDPVTVTVTALLDGGLGALVKRTTLCLPSRACSSVLTIYCKARFVEVFITATTGKSDNSGSDGPDDDAAVRWRATRGGVLVPVGGEGTASISASVTVAFASQWQDTRASTSSSSGAGLYTRSGSSSASSSSSGSRNHTSRPSSSETNTGRDEWTGDDAAPPSVVSEILNMEEMLLRHSFLGDVPNAAMA